MIFRYKRKAKVTLISDMDIFVWGFIDSVSSWTQFSLLINGESYNWI